MHKANVITILLLLVSLNGMAQNMGAYFEAYGFRGLCEMAHPSNDYVSGECTDHKDYVNVYIKSKDNLIGMPVGTGLKILKGHGPFYFTDIIVLYDFDFIKPFEATKAIFDQTQRLIELVDQKSFEKLRADFSRTFGGDPRHWSGKTWALLALNVSYLDYRDK